MKQSNNQVGEKVLVLGAGQLGASVLASLVPAVTQRNGSVCVIVSGRSRDKQSKRRSSIHQQLADAGAGTQIKITRAVLEAGVKRYFPWQFGVNYDVVGKGSGQPVWDEQYDVRTLLREQNVTEWVIVSTGIFTSFLFEPAFGVVNLAQKTINALGGWEMQVTVTSPTDIGRLTTEIYLHQPRITNEVVFVAGETTSYAKLAETVERVTQQTFTRGVLTLPDLQEQLRLHPHDPMLRYRVAFARGDGMWWPMSDTWNAQHHLPTQDIAAWLKTQQ